MQREFQAPVIKSVNYGEGTPRFCSVAGAWCAVYVGFVWTAGAVVNYGVGVNVAVVAAGIAACIASTTGC